MLSFDRLKRSGRSPRQALTAQSAAEGPMQQWIGHRPRQLTQCLQFQVVTPDRTLIPVVPDDLVRTAFHNLVRVGKDGRRQAVQTVDAVALLAFELAQ